MMRKLLYILLGLALVALGAYLGKRYEANRIFSANRLGHILELINEHYVDGIDMDSIQEAAIPLILSNLDPHSTYLTAEMNRRENEGLNGFFYGIGVQFNRLTDTVVVTRVVHGGSAERAGLQAGDRILEADTTRLYGEGFTDADVLSTLKGPDQSVVRLLIRRGGETKRVAVVRGPVPVRTIDASFVLDSTLYVRIDRWGATTHSEFNEAFVEAVRRHGTALRGIVVDLRNNAGGYLDAALALAGEFLPKDKLLLYTEGRAFPREDYYNPRAGRLRDMPLVVLVNEFSASASEIFAGIMQDHDRAQIVGRRTFGKGLVQQPFMLADSSVIRLTVARYYTPSGRSVQKSYADGSAHYAEDIERRYEHGELFNADSVVDADTVRYYTAQGRVVHGGGGVRPDIFVPRDSTGVTSYYLRLLESGTMPRFAFEYADARRPALAEQLQTDGVEDFLTVGENRLLFDYAYYAQERGVPIRTTLLHRSSSIILRHLRALIADHVSSDTNSYYYIMMRDNPELLLAINLIKEGRWHPMAEPDASAR